MPLPQKPEPQSLEHVRDDSPTSGSQMPSPQNGLQSPGQFRYDSPYCVSQTRLPHELMVQSCGHVLRSSPGSQRPLPHRPQSVGQFVGFSPGSQRPLPQRYAEQSCGQFMLFSPGSQMPLPQRLLGQSMGQLPGSPGSQMP